MASLIKKFQLYGPKNFVVFSCLAIGRFCRRLFLKSFSQNREDLIIEAVLGRPVATYIDIGSHHPVKFNNTYRFYLSGGRGVNIEPNQALINSYRRLRPHDRNLPLGVTRRPTTSVFYQLDPDVNSTFNARQAREKIKQGCTLVSQYSIKTQTLNYLFQKYFSQKPVDLLSIDTEGYDYQILQSNNWQKFHPAVICIEDYSLKTQKFLINHHYRLRAITPNNAIFTYDP